MPIDVSHDGRREVPVVFSWSDGRKVGAAVLALWTAACGDSGAGRAGALEVFVQPGAQSVALTRGDDGDVRVSWIEAHEGHTTLRWARVRERDCELLPDVARGADWFVNWADVPAFAIESDGDAWASFLVRSGSDTYDYDAWISRAPRGGPWSDPVVLHEHAGVGEHGFVSLVPLDADRTLAVWLDARDLVARGDDGAMQLWARVVTATGREPERLLDPRVCDCCPTTATRLEDGSVLIAYRDRSDDEVRDFSFVRWSAGTASEPRVLSADGWTIAGCPVNGAALGASGETVGAAWFTLGSENKARVQVSFSTDGGASFDAPRVISKGDTDGFVSAAMDDAGTLWVTWLERPTRDVATWMLAPLTVETLGEIRVLAETKPGRAAGMARLARDDDGLVFAWLDGEREPRLRVWRLPDSRAGD